ncbi:MAG: hypothetical protein J6331_01810 [Lentisphaeria bacterium]|nr:hypothetical protein [Lentisphaeria bacterium]
MRQIWLTLFLCAVIFPCLFSAERRKAFDFVRHVNVGEKYELFARFDQTSDCRFVIAGSENSALGKYESVHSDLSAVLTVESVGEKGELRAALLRIRSLSGSVNGKNVPCEELEKRSFLVRPEASGTFFTPRDGKRALKEEEALLLKPFFLSSSGSAFSDLAGEGKSLLRGEVFPLKTEKIRASLAERKIFCSEKELEAFCRYEGTFPFRNKPCGRFFLHMKSDKIPGYQFQYQATVYLPEKKEDGPPWNIQRSAVEFLARNITPANHFAAGGQMTCETKENASIVMFPCEKEEEKTPEGGFFDLLKRKGK